MAYTVTLIPGDGVGPEVAEAARRCILATGVDIEFEIAHAGVDVMEKEGTPLPESTLDSIRKNKVALKGPVTTPIGSGFRSVNVAIRKKLGLYANVRPAKYYPGVRSLMKNAPEINLVVVRENTEDLYAGIEFEKESTDAKKLRDTILEMQPDAKISEHAGISIKPISPEGTKNIVEYAFNYVKDNNRKKVTAITKANIMKHTDGLFQHVAEEVAKEHPNIEFEHMLIDNMCMQLVQKPEQYDVMVLPNLYGDIVSDLCAGLVGGLGVAPGANIGPDVAVFEPVHGSAPKYAGKNLVNPMAMILSGVLMLHHLGEHDAADRLEKAVTDVLAEGKAITYDLREDRDKEKAAGTSDMADAIVEKLG